MKSVVVVTNPIAHTHTHTHTDIVRQRKRETFTDRRTSSDRNVRLQVVAAASARQRHRFGRRRHGVRLRHFGAEVRRQARLRRLPQGLQQRARRPRRGAFSFEIVWTGQNNFPKLWWKKNKTWKPQLKMWSFLTSLNVLWFKLLK